MNENLQNLTKEYKDLIEERQIEEEIKFLKRKIWKPKHKNLFKFLSLIHLWKKEKKLVPCPVKFKFNKEEVEKEKWMKKDII